MLRLPRTAAVLALIGLTGCRPTAAPDEEAKPPPAEAAMKAPLAIPKPERPLDREGLLLAAIRARSAAAAGVDDAAVQAELDGTRFEFRIALGCSMAPPGQAGAQASFDPERRRVELSVRPDAGLSAPVVAAAAAGRFEAAEGFWIADPWLLVPHCVGEAPTAAESASDVPAPAPAAEAAPASPSSTRTGGVALVQFFTPEEPRTQRRDGRAYEAGETLPQGSALPAPGTWQLVLTGRLQALGQGGKVIFCQPVEQGAAPACIVSVRFDRVSIENRASGEQLAEWGSR